MEMVGKPLFDWQRDAMRDVMGLRRDGRWAAPEVAIWIARQNGKGVVTECQELFGAFMLREKAIVHSAHLFDTSQKAFNRTVEIIDGSDWLTQRTNKIIRGKGSEAIQLTRSMGGGSIEFKARTLHGARGLTGERITLDEAYGVTIGHYQAMSPILATMRNPQVTYTSSPPDDTTGMMPEDALTPSIRERGLGGDPDLAMLEWSPPEIFDPGDVDVWYECNPSMGLLIDEEFLARQWRVFRSSSRPGAFATEHLGVWPDSAAAQWRVIPRADWYAALDEDSSAQDPVAFAVTVSTDRQWATICAAGQREDGLYHVTIVDRREGTGWVIPRLVELWEKWSPCAVVINKAVSSPAASLAVEIEEASIDLLPIQPRDEAAAAGAFFDGVAGRPAIDPETGELGRDPRVIRHRGQDEQDAQGRPLPWARALTDAVAGAMKRPTSTVWDQVAASADISPLIGVSNALWGFRASYRTFNTGMFSP